MSTFEIRDYTVKVEDHPNADRLDIVRLDDTDYVCVSMKGLYKTGDTAVFLPEGTVLPDDLLKTLGLWDDEKQKGVLAGTKGNRVKPTKLRGILSDGFLINRNHDVFSELEEDDLASYLGVEKYEPEVPTNFNGMAFAKIEIPSYTEIENIKKGNSLEIGEHVVITEKIHGTCFIAYYEYGTLYVSSKGMAKRGLALEQDESNIYWKVALNLNLKDRLQTLGFPRVALFGEITGVQDLKYSDTPGTNDLRVFDMMLFDSAMDPNLKKFYVANSKLVEFTDFMGLQRVPKLYEGDWHPNYLEGMVEGVEKVSGKELHMREGVVVKPANERYDKYGRVIYKVISSEYLVSRGKKGATEYN